LLAAPASTMAWITASLTPAAFSFMMSSMAVCKLQFDVLILLLISPSPSFNSTILAIISFVRTSTGAVCAGGVWADAICASPANPDVIAQHTMHANAKRWKPAAPGKSKEIVDLIGSSRVLLHARSSGLRKVVVYPCGECQWKTPPCPRKGYSDRNTSTCIGRHEEGFGFLLRLGQRRSTVGWRMSWPWTR